MTYTINRMIVGAAIDDVDARARKSLADHGFGVLTKIDVKATMNKKIDVEVSAIDPVVSMQAIETAELTAMSGEVRGLLAKAVDAI